jgi:hypothetical protein
VKIIIELFPYIIFLTYIHYTPIVEHTPSKFAVSKLLTLQTFAWESGGGALKWLLR